MKKVLAALLAASAAMAAHAQQKGDNVISAGWFHVAPQQSSSELTTYSAPVPINQPLRLPQAFTSPGTGLRTSGADTLGLTFTHFLTDNIAVTNVAGVPPTFKVSGHGLLIPPGPAGALGSLNLSGAGMNPEIKSVRQWSPAILLQYYFMHAKSRVRPFVGIGVSYNWFSDIQLNSTFAQAVNNNLGSVLAAGAGKPGPTTVTAKASSSWAPVFNVGATVALTDHIGLLASVTYIPLKTTSSLVVKAADGTELAVTKGELKADPIITYLALTYKF